MVKIITIIVIIIIIIKLTNQSINFFDLRFEESLLLSISEL